MKQRLLPTGECWCGCGGETARGSFFLSGHDKVAQAAVLLVEYGGVPEFLAKHGYSPQGKNPSTELAAWRQAHRKSTATRERPSVAEGTSSP